MIRIHLSPKLKRNLSKLPPHVYKKFKTCLSILVINPFNSSLKTHKLSGKLFGLYSFSINYSYRATFEFIDENQIIIIDVGTHAIYK